MDLKIHAFQLLAKAYIAVHPLGPHGLGMYHVWSYTLKHHVLHSPGQNIKNRDCSYTIQNRLSELSTKGFAVTISTDDGDENNELQNNIDSIQSLGCGPRGNLHT